MQIALASSSHGVRRLRITRRNFNRALHRALAPQWRKSEERFMRSLIILSIVVLLKIEQELTRRPAKPAVPRRNRTSVLRR
jgi:hypothetical protein